MDGVELYIVVYFNIYINCRLKNHLNVSEIRNGSVIYAKFIRMAPRYLIFGQETWTIIK